MTAVSESLSFAATDAVIVSTRIGGSAKTRLSTITLTMILKARRRALHDAEDDHRAHGVDEQVGHRPVGERDADDQRERRGDRARASGLSADLMKPGRKVDCTSCDIRPPTASRSSGPAAATQIDSCSRSEAEVEAEARGVAVISAALSPSSRSSAKLWCCSR